jgi:pimeloyl-ACP methyl ester carboxylesterase
MAMDQAINGRELFTLDGLGVLLRGTFHRPKASSDFDPGVGRPKPVGIVFLNSLSLPRAATGDSSVYWAESFAGCGYPCFRVDLPGLGDTAGEIPNELLNFINAGGYAKIAGAKVKELVGHFGLSGVVIFGHCAGTVSAIYAAATCMAECRGLVLLDPYFHVPQAIRPALRRGLSDWAVHSSVGRMLSNIYDRIKKIKRMLRANLPPRNANFPLLSRWKEIASTGLPILIIKAPSRKAVGTSARVGEFDYLKHVLNLAGRKSQVSVELVQGTDHSFANRVGRAGVQRCIEQWLGNHVPLPEDVRLNVLLRESVNNESYNHYHLDCLQP